MKDYLTKYLEDLMVAIPKGEELVKHFRDENKWISTDSKMSIPGQKGKLTEITNTINVDSFLLAKYPVTKEVYEFITKETVINFEIDGTPQVNVTWYEAVKFCNVLSNKCGLKAYYTIDENEGVVICNNDSKGYRLPTDAEWQYACKAGSKGYRYGEIDAIAWYKDNADGILHPVGKKEPNDWNLYDMLGNSWEWCWDLYDEKTHGVYRVFRGGSWGESARGCGATCRRSGHPSFCIDDLGFRLARSI